MGLCSSTGTRDVSYVIDCLVQVENLLLIVAVYLRCPLFPLLWVIKYLTSPQSRCSVVAEGIMAEFQRDIKDVHGNNDHDSADGAKILRMLETTAKLEVLDFYIKVICELSFGYVLQYFGKLVCRLRCWIFR